MNHFSIHLSSISEYSFAPVILSTNHVIYSSFHVISIILANFIEMQQKIARLTFILLSILMIGTPLYGKTEFRRSQNFVGFVFGFQTLIFAEFFSPNGDGHNDTFVIKNIEEFPINQLHVFNRWGEKVYEAEPYMNDWDGTVNTQNQVLGNTVPDGTYFYRFEFLIGDFVTRKNGKVIIKR